MLLCSSPQTAQKRSPLLLLFSPATAAGSSLIRALALRSRLRGLPTPSSSVGEETARLGDRGEAELTAQRVSFPGATGRRLGEEGLCDESLPVRCVSFGLGLARASVQGPLRVVCATKPSPRPARLKAFGQGRGSATSSSSLVLPSDSWKNPLPPAAPSSALGGV